MTDIQAWLDQGHTLTDEIATGAQERDAWEHEWDGGRLLIRTTGVMPTEIGETYDVPDMPLYADWIADARTRLPQALAALQTIHDLHQPVEFVGHSTTWLRCTQGCPTWPCPTRQALPHIQAATETAQGKPTDDEDQA